MPMRLAQAPDSVERQALGSSRGGRPVVDEGSTYGADILKIPSDVLARASRPGRGRQTPTVSLEIYSPWEQEQLAEAATHLAGFGNNPKRAALMGEWS